QPGRAQLGAREPAAGRRDPRHHDGAPLQHRPWQLACAQTGAVLRVAPIGDDGALDVDAFGALLGPRTRLVAVAHVSNALGTVNPVAELARRARAAGAVVLVDGAQAVAHLAVDVQAIGCDFYAFSGHK